MDDQIPKLSLNSLLKNDDQSLKLLSNALSNHGFFIITDHKISHSLFNKAYEYSEKFFNVDISVKNKYWRIFYWKTMERLYMGYGRVPSTMARAPPCSF